MKKIARWPGLAGSKKIPWGGGGCTQLELTETLLNHKLVYNGSFKTLNCFIHSESYFYFEI